mgnify:CR=1 FL=1
MLVEELQICNKSNCSYKELSVLTGYHPKSLVRINSMIKKEKYKILEEERGIYGKNRNSCIRFRWGFGLSRF